MVAKGKKGEKMKIINKNKTSMPNMIPVLLNKYVQFYSIISK